MSAIPIGYLSLWPGDAPKGWVKCEGQSTMELPTEIQEMFGATLPDLYMTIVKVEDK